MVGHKEVSPAPPPPSTADRFIPPPSTLCISDAEEAVVEGARTSMLSATEESVFLGKWVLLFNYNNNGEWRQNNITHKIGE
jgi:hypothetical protein